MSQQPNLDTQPEPDLPPAELASLSLGLFLGAGLVLGTMIGALIGHFWLDDAFGWGQDVLVGAVVGAILGALLSIGGVRLLTSRIAHRKS